MQRIVLVAVATLAACSSTQNTPRTAVPPASGATVSLQMPPATATAGASEAAKTADNEATQAWLRAEVAEKRAKEAQGNAAPVVQGSVQPEDLLKQRGMQSATDEDATKAWLQQTADDRRAADTTSAPVPLQQTVFVDRPIYTERYVDPYGYGYDAYGHPVYGYGYGYESCRQSDFPVNTVVGAGIGAIVGHGSKHQGRDIAIGAGIGLLFDLPRWF